MTDTKLADHKAVMAEVKSEKGRPPQFIFMKMPEELQDRIIDGLDNHTMSMMEAAKACREAGFDISHETIRRYYQVLCAQRTMYDLDHIIVTMMQKYTETDPRDALLALSNMISTQLFKGLQDGSIKFGAADPGKILKSLSELLTLVGAVKEQQKKEKREKIIDLPAESKNKIKKELYGVE